MRSTILIWLSAAFTLGAAAQEHPGNTLPVRGFCIAAPRPADVDRFVVFVDSELAPRHVNTLVLRVDYNFRYKSRPELADPGGLSLADVKKLVAVCRKDHIHLIPQINLLGHQSFHTYLGKLLRAHPEFDETPWIKMPAKYKWPNPDNLYCKSYCPLHPGLHEVVFAVMDELCDAFESDAFHAGMDEVFYIGESKCPYCAGHDPAELFAGEVRAIHDHLQAHGRHLWIWGDRLLDSKTTGLGMWEASPVGTAPAIDLIPKDVTICDWHYNAAVPTPAYFAFKGFHVISCPWKNSAVAVDQVDDMIHWRERAPQIMKDRFEGVMQTVWSSADKFLDDDYAGTTKTNSWDCFLAWSAEIDKLARNPEPAAAKK